MMQPMTRVAELAQPLYVAPASSLVSDGLIL